MAIKSRTSKEKLMESEKIGSPALERDEEEATTTARESQHHTVTVSVNEQPVKLQGHKATGAEIKAAAIAQGVIIQPNFVLQEELPNGNSRIVGDADEVHLREHLRFTAIAPDDNS
jgi:hypothetical protein